MMLSMPADILDPAMGLAPALSGRPRTRPEAVRSFESLFIETLLNQAGLGQALDPGGNIGGGTAGELLVRELAQKLAGQLPLGFTQAMGEAAR